MFSIIFQHVEHSNWCSFISSKLGKSRLDDEDIYIKFWTLLRWRKKNRGHFYLPSPQWFIYISWNFTFYSYVFKASLYLSTVGKSVSLWHSLGAQRPEKIKQFGIKLDNFMHILQHCNKFFQLQWFCRAECVYEWSDLFMQARMLRYTILGFLSLVHGGLPG